jgi:type II secretory pathway pseudopilin PulG
MTSQNKEAPVNRTFKLEGWMPIALFVALLLIGILAALILPNFIDAP